MITFIKIIHFLIKMLALYDYSHYICNVIKKQSKTIKNIAIMKVIDFKNRKLDLNGALFIHGEKDYSACTATVSSRKFKTLKGTIQWLNKRGYTEA